MSTLFGLNVLKRNVALVPLVGICGAACVMCAGYVGYMCATKPDISFRTSSWSKEGAPYQKVRPDEIRKLVDFSKPPTFDPEIEALKRELGNYKL